MNQSELISVIVPIYKVEAYLDRCVQSIVDQTYRNLEIILVDDGSPDNCPKMCDAWAAKDSRIKVVHRKNGGAGRARNIGIKAATGTLVAFVDGDDYIATQMYEYLHELLKSEYGVAECGYVVTSGNDADFEMQELKYDLITCSAKDALREHIHDNIFRQIIWNKLYRRNVIEDINFPEGKLIDDEYWTYRVIGKCKKLIHSHSKLYAYRQQDSSVMHRAYSLQRLQAVEAKSFRCNFIMEQYPELGIEARVNLSFTALYHGQLAYRCLEVNEREQAMLFLKKILKEYMLTKNDKSSLSFTDRIWIELARISFEFTCILRNILKIGL